MKTTFIFSLFCVFLFVSEQAFTQKKQLTTSDAVWQNPELYPARMPQLQWMPDSRHYSWVSGNTLLIYNVSRNEAVDSISIQVLNKAISRAGLDSLSRIPEHNWLDEGKILFRADSCYLVFNQKTLTIVKRGCFPAKAENISPAAEGKLAAYTLMNNLYLADGNKQLQITDEPEGVVCGQTVHRVEFGIDRGIFWSPDASKLAFYRKDERMVTDYPLVNIESRIALTQPLKYPMAGMASEEVTLGVYHLQTGKTVFLKTDGPADQYLTSISWNPDNEIIYIGVLNRDQNHLKLNAYDVETGDFIKTLFEEKDDKYVEPENHMHFIPGSNERFVWLSERDGYDHLYLYNTNGELIRQLTKGQWVVSSFLGFNENGSELYYQSTEASPLERHTYRLDIHSGATEKVTPQAGVHYTQASSDGRYFLDDFSDMSSSQAYQLLNSKGKQLFELKADRKPLQAYDLGEMIIDTLHAYDGTPLYYRLIKPADFEEGKQYPAIVYVYGGPHAQLITNSWLGGAGLFLNYLAQRGYVVFTLDNRGSANRGKAFEQAIYRQLGQTEVEDQMRGIEFLKSLDFVDADRIGVNGWSYGGFLAISLMLDHPEVFKVGVAGGPVVDWKWYEVMYGERYMDTPESNPEGYRQANLIYKAHKLSGRLMIIHGTMDPTVVWQHSLAFLQACIDKSIQLDYFVYPGHGHNVRGKDRAHLYDKISLYFDDFLK